ncbi:MAG: hypothetical protein ABJP45_14535 [Cyclobacteriaceae bacterium]
MNTATKLNELAVEYVHFQKLVAQDSLELSDHLKVYESLSNKLDEAGISFYDMGVYVRSQKSKTVI